MNEALVVILAFLWALLLLPAAVRSRRSDPRSTVGGFARTMEVLRRRSPDGSAAASAGRNVTVGRARAVHRSAADPSQGADRPRRPGFDPVLYRRRRVFVALVVALPVATVVAAVVGGGAWIAAAAVAAGLAGYVVLLRRWKLQRDRARSVIRGLHLAQRAHDAVAPDVAEPDREVPEAVGGALWSGDDVEGVRILR